MLLLIAATHDQLVVGEDALLLIRLLIRVPCQNGVIVFVVSALPIIVFLVDHGDHVYDRDPDQNDHQ